jgi:hypothetical protein
MRKSIVAGLVAVSLVPPLLAPGRARGQVITVSVGVQPKCPYGLSVCWPEAHEGLVLMKGVESVDREPSLETWTGTLRTKDGIVPDPAAWSREFKDIVGGTFGFRGVEVIVEGDLKEDQGHLTLKVPGSSTLIRLAPLGRKIQWDPERKCEQAPTDAERTAYRRLADRVKETSTSNGRSSRIRIIGPLEGAVPGEQPMLAVRDFSWR